MTTILIHYNNLDHQIDASTRHKHTINQELVIMADVMSCTLVQLTNDTIDSVYIEEGYEGERRLVYFPYSLKEEICRVIVGDTERVYLIRRGKSCLKRKCDEDIEGEWKKKKVCENVKEVVFNFKEILSCILTKYWSREMEDSFKLEEVEKGSDEFEMLAGDFYQHMSYYGSNILGIQRVQNLDCLNRYTNKYIEVMKKPQNSNKTIERRMYHGTPEQFVNKIIREGLDYRLAKSTGSLGSSAYFGESPITSLNYIDLNKNEKLMLVCRVIVGTSVKGKPGLRRPPYIHKTLDLADSVYGDLGHDRIFGIFDLDQILVEYVIKFSIDDNKIKCLKLKNHITQSNNNLSVSGNIDMKASTIISPKIEHPNPTLITKTNVPSTFILNSSLPTYITQGMKDNRMQNNIQFNNQFFPIRNNQNDYQYNIPYSRHIILDRYQDDINRYNNSELSIYSNGNKKSSNVIIIN